VPYLILFRYGAAFLAGVALALLWHSNVMRGVQIERIEQAAELVRVNDENQQRIAEIDTTHTEALRLAVLSVPSINERVYIRAKCPAVPAGDSAGVDTGARAELDADDQQLVYELRLGAVRIKAKLDACQAVLRPQ
jgi:hypothetical protein